MLMKSAVSPEAKIIAGKLIDAMRYGLGGTEVQDREKHVDAVALAIMPSMGNVRWTSKMITALATGEGNEQVRVLKRIPGGAELDRVLYNVFEAL